MATIDILRKLCKKRGLTIKALEEQLGYSNGSLSKADSLKGERLYEIAQFFNVSMEYLLGKPESTPYYLDPEAAALAQEIFDNPNLKILFDATRDVSKEDLEIVLQITQRLLKKK